MINSVDSPFVQQIVKAVGTSIESNTFDKFSKVYFNDEATAFYSRVCFFLLSYFRSLFSADIFFMIGANSPPTPQFTLPRPAPLAKGREDILWFAEFLLL